VKVETVCPNCQSHIEILADSLAVQANLLHEYRTRTSPVQFFHAKYYENHPDAAMFLKEAERFAKNFSKEGNVHFAVWAGKAADQFVSYAIQERFLEYNFAFRKLIQCARAGDRVLDIGSAGTVLSGITAALGFKAYPIDVQGWDLKADNMIYTKCDLTDENIPLEKDFFDFGLCISSIEHFGLTRFGDKKAVNGDIEGMKTIKGLLKVGAKFVLTLPVGIGAIVYPAHRVYNKARLADLIEGFNILEKEFQSVSKETGFWECSEEQEAFSTENFGYSVGHYLLEKV
jgi:hypothetical protein